MPGKKVFIIGPGFIGWNVLDLLVAENYIVTGLVRRQSHATQIEKSGAKTIISDLHDAKTITSTTVEHDIILHTATADDLPSVHAVLEGIRLRADQGKSTIYIHTSGTSILDDQADGSYKSNKIYSDTDRASIDALPITAPHREIDTAIVNFQNELGTQAKIAIMIPPLIYGLNPSHRRLTIQIPTLTRFALKHGFAGHIGPGLAVESNIHVLDLARAYTILLHHLESSTPATTLENPYYFCEATDGSEPSWLEIARAIGTGLYSAGRIQSAEPRIIPRELWGDLFGGGTGAVVGLNSRSRAVRLRELGWRPREKGWEGSLMENELPEILRAWDEERGEFKGYTGVAVK